MITLLPITFALIYTLTPGVWDGFAGTSKVSSGHATLQDCAEALKDRGPGKYGCRNITHVVISESEDAVDLSWTPPTKNTDGSPLTNLAGYEINYGLTPAMELKFELQEPTLSRWTMSELTPGTWYFSIKSFNTHSTRSSPSNIAFKVIE